MNKRDKKTLMVIAAGFGQLPAIRTAKKMGLRVIAVDQNKNAVGMKEADLALPIDVKDIRKIVKAAKENKIDGVLTMQSDLPVWAVGAVNKALSLTGVNSEVAHRCSNKIATRRYLKKRSVPQPKFSVCTCIADLKKAAKRIGLPVVVKAADSSGSRGVTKVNREGELKQALSEALKYSRQKEVLVEKYIEGEELGAQAFSYRGKCRLVLLHNDTVSKPPYMIPVGHSYPSNLPQNKLKNAERAVKAAVEALEIYDGPSNIDLIIDQDGEAKIIEIGARIGATCLPELTSYFTGIDYVKQAILSALGQKPDLKVKQQKPCAAIVLTSSEDGILKSYKTSRQIKTDKDLLEFEMTAQIGAEVNVFRKGTDRIGKIVTKGKTAQEAEKLAEKLKNLITLEVFAK